MCVSALGLVLVIVMIVGVDDKPVTLKSEPTFCDTAPGPEMTDATALPFVPHVDDEPNMPTEQVVRLPATSAIVNVLLPPAPTESDPLVTKVERFDAAFVSVVNVRAPSNALGAKATLPFPILPPGIASEFVQ